MRWQMRLQLSVARPIVDGELVDDYGRSLLLAHARMPLMTGLARHEWGHKKAAYYGIDSGQPLNMSRIGQLINMVVQQSYSARDGHRLANSTWALITNATLYAYVQAQSADVAWPVDRLVHTLQQVGHRDNVQSWQMEADMEFVAPLYAEIDAYASAGRAPVYAYIFDHVPARAITEVDTVVVDVFGARHQVRVQRHIHFAHAFHGLDHAYIFTRGYTSNMHLAEWTEQLPSL